METAHPINHYYFTLSLLFYAPSAYLSPDDIGIPTLSLRVHMNICYYCAASQITE